MWTRFFSGDLVATSIPWAWSPWGWLALSGLVSTVSALLALQWLHGARALPYGLARTGQLTAGALSLGGSMAALHGLGMQGFAPPHADPLSALHASWATLPSWLAAGYTVYTLSRPHPAQWHVWLSGLVLGLGWALMYLAGLDAAGGAPTIWEQPLGALLALGTCLAILAQHIYCRWQRKGARGASQVLISGATLGMAATCVHYLATGARHLPAGHGQPHTTLLGTWGWLHTSTALCTVVGMLLLGLHMALRWRQMFVAIQRSEARKRAVVETAVDGIIKIEGDGRISDFNPAAERLLGWKAHEVIGRNVSLLMPAPHQHAHDGYLQRHLATGHTSIIGSGREVQALHKDGSLIDVRLAVGRVALAGKPLFVGFLTDIRQRKAIEQSLLRSEEQHRTLISNMPGVSFRRHPHALWQPLFLSTAVESLTGWPAEALLAQPQRLAQMIHPQDVERLHQTVQQALHAGEAYTQEYRLRHHDGALRWVSEHGRGVYDSEGCLQWIDGVLLDHTATKARNAEFEGTLAAINRAEAVVEYSMQGHVLHANPNFLEVFGYRLDEVLGAHFDMFSLGTPEAQAQDTQLWQALQRGEHVSRESPARGQGNRVLWVRTTFSPILDANGTPLRITQLLSDITASRALAQELQQAKDKAEAAAAGRTTFLANMSHEIRTPMNAIIGFSEALLDTPLRPTQQHYVETVYRSARSMLRLLNDILDTAKLDKGAVSIEVNDFCVADVCHLAVGAQRIHAEKKSLQLLLQIAPDTPAYLRGDALRVQQIMNNLLGNAVKFTEQGSVCLAVDYREGQLQLRVQDTGIGIAPDKLAHIFDPFAQADTSTTRRFGGTGLGTTISRQLAQLMGGHISVQSQLGQGSEFAVQLPLSVGQAPRPAEAVPAQPALGPLHILAADDVPQNLELLQVVMQRYGHQVLLAHDGAQAVHMRQQQHFDLILMDLQMPTMDGLEATRAIRAWEASQGHAAIPIIALSASVRQEDRSASDEAGMDGFATKPLEPTKLLQEIARVLPSARPAALAPQAVAVAVHMATAPVQWPLDGSVADWHTGLQLWGGAAPLRAAWVRFMAEQHNRIPELQHMAQQSDWAAACAVVHRMRGACGNLALTALHQTLTRLETAARTRDEAAFLAQLPALATGLAHVEALLNATAPTAAATAPLASLATDRIHLSSSACTQAHSALHTLCNGLPSGEIDSAALQQLQALLSAEQLAPVQAALDVFDFDQAHQAASTLAQTLVPATPSC